MALGVHTLAVHARQLDVHADVGEVLGHGFEGGGQSAVGLEHDWPAPAAKLGGQTGGPPPLEERLTAGQAHRVVGELPAQRVGHVRHLRHGKGTAEDQPVAPSRRPLDATGPRSALERLGLVAVGTADVAAGQPHEDLPVADQRPFALDGREDFAHKDVVGVVRRQHGVSGRRRRRHRRAGSATPTSAKPRARRTHASHSRQGRSPPR